MGHRALAPLTTTALISGGRFCTAMELRSCSGSAGPCPGILGAFLQGFGVEISVSLYCPAAAERVGAALEARHETSPSRKRHQSEFL